AGADLDTAAAGDAAGGETRAVRHGHPAGPCWSAGRGGPGVRLPGLGGRRVLRVGHRPGRHRREAGLLMAAADLAGETIDFDGLPIEYDDTVLTPRPWTAAQSHWARELLATAPDGPVLELCAGAGHIGLLAVHGTGRALVQVDASVHACAWAVRNARRCGVPAEVRHGRMGDMLAPQERFAVIIADPPWVPSDGVDRFPADPRTAIDGGPDGLDLARECVTIIGRHLQARGAAVLQVADREQAA